MKSFFKDSNSSWLSLDPCHVSDLTMSSDGLLIQNYGGPKCQNTTLTFHKAQQYFREQQ